ncbi:hypothetical protein [Kitasatospora griseola]|uniref:hypothetical protein n=1 Tax=Kitasatospora griseola TaxID=2064 RepID=UPI000695BBC4|nr:hypothetical protein [Kitasatospora griseola]
MPALPEHDFEDRLCQVFHETGESFVPDTPRLAMGGATRGRRRQRRRLALGAAAAVLAVSGLGAAVLPSALQTNSTGPAASPVPSPLVSDTPDAARIPQEAHLVSAVAERLPADLRIVRSTGTTHGTAAFESGIARAELTLEDGHGPSLLMVNIMNTTGWGPSHACPGYPIKGVECQETVEPDGTKVAVTEFTTPDPEPKKKFTEVELNAPDGMRITVASFNSLTTSGDPTRPDPLLSVDRLRALAVDPWWRAFDALRPATHRTSNPAGGRTKRPDLLPAGLKVLSSTDSGQLQSATLADGGRTVELTVQQEQADAPVREWFAGAPALPDGTLVRSVTARPVPNAQGATETIVDVLRSDGARVRVTAANPAGAGSPDAGQAPLLTLDQLTAIALCPGWTVPASS